MAEQTNYAPYILPVGAVAGGVILLNKLGFLRSEADHTVEVKVNPKKLTYEAAFYKTTADQIYNNMNSYWTIAGNIKTQLDSMKTPDDKRELYKAFGKRPNTSNVGIVNFDVGRDKDLKQWLLDYHTTSFSDQWVFNYFKSAGL